MKFTELDVVGKTCTRPQAPQDRPQAQQEAAEDPILSQVPLTARKRSLVDMSENMHLDLVFGIHPGVPAVAARDVLMNPKRPDGPQGDSIRQVMSPRSATTLPSGSGLTSSSSQPVTGEASAKRYKENLEKMNDKTSLEIREEIKDEIRNEVKNECLECIKQLYQAATINMEESKKQLTKSDKWPAEYDHGSPE